jgi:hypothetical protein
MFIFMKNKLRNRLGLHLDTIVHMFAQKFYTQHTIKILGFSNYAHWLKGCFLLNNMYVLTNQFDYDD